MAKQTKQPEGEILSNLCTSNLKLPKQFRFSDQKSTLFPLQTQATVCPPTGTEHNIYLVTFSFLYCLSRRVRQGHLQRSSPTSTILWFCNCFSARSEHNVTKINQTKTIYIQQSDYNDFFKITKLRRQKKKKKKGTANQGTTTWKTSSLHLTNMKYNLTERP